ncbi:MAG TPA: nucleoside-diphosphate kinase [Chloroflexota bacterium]|nr:nucleoside-diphosphate kinase [Chloroflexota bacterium]
MERTLVIVKPDGVQRGLIGEVLKRLETRGLKMVGLKMMAVSPELAQRHYAVHQGKPFFEGLIRYITSSPVVVAVFEGKDAIAAVRSTVGATNPVQATPGTIRGDFGMEIGRNLVHASDAPDTAKAEIALWFKEEELVSWSRDTDRWISE